MCLLERSHACGILKCLRAQVTDLVDTAKGMCQLVTCRKRSQSKAKACQTCCCVGCALARDALALDDQITIPRVCPLCPTAVEASRALSNKLCGPEGADTESGLYQLVTCGKRSQKKAVACNAVMNTAALGCGVVDSRNWLSVGPLSFATKWLANRLCGPKPVPETEVVPDTEQETSAIPAVPHWPKFDSVAGLESDQYSSVRDYIRGFAKFSELTQTQKQLISQLYRDAEKTKPDRRRVLSSERSPFWDLAELLA